MDGAAFGGLLVDAAAIALKFGADFGNFGPEVVDRRLEVGCPSGRGRTDGSACRGSGLGQGLIGAGIHLFHKIAQIHPLFGIEFAQVTEQVRGGFFDIFRHQFRHGTTDEKGFDEWVMGRIGATIHGAIHFSD